MKFKFLACLFLNFYFLGLFAEVKQAKKNSSFVVTQKTEKKKVLSKNRSKEQIGLEMEKALNLSADLTKKIAEIQIELSELQRQLFQKVGQLVENKRPFKKASKSSLNKSLAVIRNVNAKFTAQLEGVKNLRNKINSDECLKRNT